MAINPLNSVHRQRLGRAADHSQQELNRFALCRANTVQAYLGVSPEFPGRDYLGTTNAKKYKKSLPKGNLLQTAGLSLQIALAYGEPEYLALHRVPDHAGLANKLGPALNRVSKLLNLGETARAVAADSFFGYGIFKVGNGYLPSSARIATGLESGPCVWRVSQEHFLYDVTWNRPIWEGIPFVGDDYTMPLEEAQMRWPAHADRLQGMTDIDRIDQQHVMARSYQANAPEELVRIIDMYFPATGVVAQWAIQNGAMTSLADEPLEVQEYTGHWSGVYEVLNHLYSPDELIPIAQAESVKALHFLFNDLLGITSEQSRLAKVNPIYQQGADKDMLKIWQADDRKPVGVIDPSRFSMWKVPGPSQDQTAYMAAIQQLFKQFIATSDEPQRAPTAMQGNWIRQTTNAVVAEARRKFNRSLQLVGYKLGHLLMESDELMLPSSKQLIPGSRIMVDSTWLPKNLEPRTGQIDDFDLNIEPYSTIYRSPEERQQQLFSAVQQIQVIMQLKAQGSPINVEMAIDTMSSHMGLPELKEWYEEADPLYQAQAQASRQSSARLGVGEYTRHNVSEATDAGELQQNLTQTADGGDGGMQGFE